MIFRTERLGVEDVATLEILHAWMEQEFAHLENTVACQGMPPYPALNQMVHMLESGYPTFARWEGDPEEPVAYMVTSMDGTRIMWARQRTSDAPFGSPLHIERQARGFVDAYLATGAWIDWASIGINTPAFLALGDVIMARAQEMLVELGGGP